MPPRLGPAAREAATIWLRRNPTNAPRDLRRVFPYSGLQDWRRPDALRHLAACARMITTGAMIADTHERRAIDRAYHLSDWAIADILNAPPAPPADPSPAIPPEPNPEPEPGDDEDDDPDPAAALYGALAERLQLRFMFAC